MNKIKSLKIDKFRHLENIEIELGNNLTIIAGGNGTGKTSIMGLIAHVFTSNHKGLDGKVMSSVFSEVFRFSKEKDKGKEHKYTLVLENGEEKRAVSRETTEKGKERFRIDVGERSTNKGKMSRPLVFLSLKRLIPLAQEREGSIKLGEEGLGEDLALEYQRLHNKIFAVDSTILPEYTKSVNKRSFSPTTEEYDSHGISAGQDNIGQIILALLSFKNLQNTLDDDYEGGVLIIDELDATLYPAAQKNLLDILLKDSAKLRIQVIFTTHSTDILKHILEDEVKKHGHNSKVVFLDKTNGKVEVYQEPQYLGEVLASLNHQVYKSPKTIKTNIYFEDEEARIFFRNIIKLRRGLSSKLNIQAVNLGEGFYKELLKKKFPEFNNSIVVLDGDARDNFKGQQKPKLCFLPGLTRPENVIYDFLNSLPEDDVFWDTGISGYKKQVFIQNKPANLNSRDDMKNWFNREKECWGKGAAKLYKRWLEDTKNMRESERFLKTFEGYLDKVRKNII